MKRLLRQWLKRFGWLVWLWTAASGAMAGGVDGGHCVAPARPGGGFELTCQLVRELLQRAGQTQAPLAITFRPGGIGALAFRSAVNQKPPDGTEVLAFSSGSLLNLAQGRFGPYTPRDVRWLAVVGMDYGVVAVHRDAPYRKLPELLAALRDNPNKVVFGGGGSIGSQDWMKAALLARAAGVSHKTLRFVAFEGGGEALTALAGQHVQVLAGDAAELGQYMDQGAAVRVLAVLAPRRLGARWAGVPTAKEQGVAVEWPIARGLYMGPNVPEHDYREWVEALSRAVNHPAVAEHSRMVGLERAWLAGPELTQMVTRQTADFKKLAVEFGLVR